MAQADQYLAILRCQTWNVWPEMTRIKCHGFRIAYGESATIPVNVELTSYLNRSDPEKYLNEKTEVGPYVVDDITSGLHRVKDSILKAPDDVGSVSLQYRNSQRGEIDICINFRFEGEIPKSLIEAARATAYSIMSLVNLELSDALTATGPFHIQKVLPEGGASIESSFLIFVQNRKILEKETIGLTLKRIATSLHKSAYGEQLRIALELYAAHFSEQQVRVRCLLLVTALESLTTASQKHAVALVLLGRWQDELKAEMLCHNFSSEESMTLEALSRELGFRAEDSIRSQIRKLFSNLSGIENDEAKQLQRRALHLYDKRSILVHDGYLPDDELLALENEARELLEKLFLSAMVQTNDVSPA